MGFVMAIEDNFASFVYALLARISIMTKETVRQLKEYGS